MEKLVIFTCSSKCLLHNLTAIHPLSDHPCFCNICTLKCHPFNNRRLLCLQCASWFFEVRSVVVCKRYKVALVVSRTCFSILQKESKQNQCFSQHYASCTFFHHQRRQCWYTSSFANSKELTRDLTATLCIIRTRFEELFVASWARHLLHDLLHCFNGFLFFVSLNKKE